MALALNNLKRVDMPLNEETKPRISRLSSDKKIFHESNKMYIEALKNSGFKEEFTYVEPKVPNNINIIITWI